MNKPAFSAHEKETLWIGLLFMVLLYAAMARFEGVEGDAGLYGKLADAYLSGHTYLLESPPQNLLDSPNPYAIQRGTPEMRYSDYLLYEGRFYLPYGPIPALLAFAPFKYITGHDLSLNFVVFAFACIGTITLIFLYRALAVMLGVENDCRFRAAVFLLIAGTFIPIGISLPSHYQVSLMGSYGFTALAFWCLLKTLESQRWAYLALCGLCLGLAAGCRLNFAFAGIVIIGLLKYYWLRAGRWRISKEYFLKACCIGMPWLFCILGLLYYNDVRFHSPFDTGIAYQIMWKSLKGGGFSLHRVLVNLYFFLFNPIPLTWSFPFFHPAQCCRDVVTVPWPTDVDLSTQEPLYGAFTNAPFLWFCFLSLWMLRRRIPPTAALMIVAFWGVALAVLPVLLLMNSTMRYLVDFVPWLMLTACLGYAWLMTTNPRPWLLWTGRLTMIYTLTANLAYGLVGFMHVTFK